MKRYAWSVFVVCCFFFFTGQSSAWHDRTHLAVAKAAGYNMWYNAAAADLVKVKAAFIESGNHYFNNSSELEVTPDLVLAQAARYNKSSDKEGHLYGAIIGSLSAYEKSAAKGRYAEYHLAFAAHYIGDLSQPLHNTPYDSFNKEHHAINDGIVDSVVLDHPGEITKRMYEIELSDGRFEDDLAREIARIANLSRHLGYVMRADGGRDMTPQEAYEQLAHSASLFKAVLKHYGKI